MRTDPGSADAGGLDVPARPSDLPSVMLIEDDPDMAYLLGRALKRSESFTMTGQATDLESARSLLETQSPEVIVVDARLLGESDLALVPVVRGSCPDATIVVLTALSSSRLEAQAYAAGADFFVEKNAAAGRLVQRIAELIAS